VAFFGLFAIFPGLTSLISLYALIADPVEVQLKFAVMQDIMPQEAYRIISGQLNDIVTAPRGSLGAGFIGGLILTIWGASRGMRALIMALNVTYNVDETRGFFRLNLLAMFLTICAMLFIISSLFLIVIVPPILLIFDFLFEYQDLIFIFRWVLLAVFTVFGLTLIYRYAPDTKRRKWQWYSWGAVFATFFWLIGSWGFSFYVAHFGNYNEIYGSMGAVIILLMWFYLTAYLILIGAQLNAEIFNQSEKKKRPGFKQRPKKKKPGSRAPFSDR
jgi:membrane protein